MPSLFPHGRRPLPGWSWPWGGATEGAQRPWTEGLQATFFDMSVRKLSVEVSHAPYLGKGVRVQERAVSSLGHPCSAGGAASGPGELPVNSAPSAFWVAIPQSLSTSEKSLSSTAVTLQSSWHSLQETGFWPGITASAMILLRHQGLVISCWLPSPGHTCFHPSTSSPGFLHSVCSS